MEWINWSTLAHEFAAWMADVSLRDVALALLALLLIPFVRRSSTTQHATWAVVLVGMLALPLLRPVVPAMHLHLPQVLAQRVKQKPPSLIAQPRILPVSGARVTTASAEPAPPVVWWPLVTVGVYLLGVVLFGGRLLGGVLLTRRALRTTRMIPSELWQYYELVAQANVDLSLEESDSVCVPLTTGSQHLRVILPADWREWPRAKVKAVLAHELAHAQRRDPLIALLAAVNKCVFWFHPLAWWLARRLAVLAEHAADDAALAVLFDSEAYARLLLESTARLENGGRRLMWYSAAMSGPVVAQRIRRVLDLRTAQRLKPLGNWGRAILVSAGAMLIWFSTTVDVRLLSAGQANPTMNGGLHKVSSPDLVTAEQAAALEQELAANPEDEATRGKLLRYYTIQSMFCKGAPPLPGCSDGGGQQASERRIPLILWLIDHHPESELFGDPDTSIFPQIEGPNVYQNLKNHWLTQVNVHPDDAQVLFNAASSMRFGLNDNLQQEIDLLKRVQKLAPGRPTELLASLYASVLLNSEPGAPNPREPFNDPGIAAQVKNELQSSTDAALLGSVAQHVYAAEAAMNSGAADIGALRTLATELVTRAHMLDPQNREWSTLMEGVKGLPPGSLAAVAQTAPAQTTAAQAATTPAPAIRIGGAVQAQNLVEAPAPIYPPLAKAAKVQGTVMLQIRIGTDGHVTDATLISGHPLLVTAAIDAAKLYIYKPTMLNNQPTAVLTDVEIAFPPAKP